MATLLLLQIASTWSMVGLIWFVQISHYPLFSNVHPTVFPAYEDRHRRLTTYVVAPLMFTELGSAILLCLTYDENLPVWLPWLGLALVGVIWLSTALLQVPAHKALSAEFSQEQLDRLVRTNWIRTIAWSLRGLLVLVMLMPFLKI